MPLHKATMSTQDIVKYLIEEVNVEKEAREETDQTPHHFAAKGGKDNMVKCLHKLRADKEARDWNGRRSNLSKKKTMISLRSYFVRGLSFV